MSVKIKLLASFFVAVIAAVALSLVALISTWALADRAVQMFDRPLMAINFARSAQTGFTIVELLDRDINDARDPATRDAVTRRVERQIKDFLDDVDIAVERGISPEIPKLAAQIKQHATDWREKAKATMAAPTGSDEAFRMAFERDDIGNQIRKELEILTQTAADDGFIFREESEEIIRETKIWTSSIIGLLLFVCFGVVIMLVRNIVQPLDTMARSMIRLARGDFTIGVPSVERGDEIGQMGRSLGVFKQAMMDVSEARERAETATKAKSEFLAMMSHEIRTPMNGVLGMARLLLGTRLDTTQKDYAQLVLDSGQSLLTILNDILDYSKLEAGRLEIEVVDFDLRYEVNSIVALLAPKAEEKGIFLKANIAVEVPRWLKGDPHRLRQVLLNLTGNSIKFTERGGVTLQIEQRGLEGDISRLHFAVVDTGIGISAEAKSKLFASFSQADTSITRRFGGTGLGLAISKNIVELMNGEIGVDSEPGRGSTFWFDITLKEGEQPREHAVVGGPKLSVRPLRVLLTEDNIVNQKVAIGFLKLQGHTIEVANNGREGVEAVAAQDFDVVLMDMHMPEMGGLEATKLIRTLPAPRGQVPIIALTASAGPDAVQEAMEAGMNAYVPKPVNPETLTAALIKLFGAIEIEGTSDSEASPVEEGHISDRLAGGAEPLDVAVLATLEEQLGRELVVELVGDFITSSRDLFEQMKSARAAGNIEAWGDAAHGLKSAAGSLGLGLVYRTALVIEDACRDDRRDHAEKAHAALGGELEAGWQLLRDRYASNTAVPPQG